MKLRFLYVILLAIAIARGDEENTSTNDPSVTESTTLESTTTESTTTESTTTESTTPESTTPESTTTESTTTESTTTESTTTESTTTESTTTESTTTESTTTESTTTESTTPESTTTESTTTESTTTESTTTESTTTESTTTESTTTESPTTNSTTTDSPTTNSTTTDSSATDPPTSTIASIEEYPHQVIVENKTCILSRMKISITVSYNTKDDKVEKKTIDVPSKATISGTCGDTNSVMIFTWSISENLLNGRIFNNFDTGKNEVSLLFKKTDSTYAVDEITVKIFLDEKNFPNAKDSEISQTTGKSLSLFSTSTNGKYVCDVQTFVTTENMELSITDVNLMAFLDDDDYSSRSEENCVATSNVGAIVGGVIGALAVIGIIGFIIWRRRKNATTHSEVA